MTTGHYLGISIRTSESLLLKQSCSISLSSLKGCKRWFQLEYGWFWATHYPSWLLNAIFQPIPSKMKWNFSDSLCTFQLFFLLGFTFIIPIRASKINLWHGLVVKATATKNSSIAIGRESHFSFLLKSFDSSSNHLYSTFHSLLHWIRLIFTARIVRLFTHDMPTSHVASSDK